MSDEAKLYRCMGGSHCKHIPGTCTATNTEYRARIKQSVVNHPATLTPVVDHETGNMSDKDLIERVARWMCDQSPYSADDWRDYVEDAMSLLRAIDLPGQREAAARAALEAATDTLAHEIRAIDPAAFRGDSHDQ